MRVSAPSYSLHQNTKINIVKVKNGGNKAINNYPSKIQEYDIQQGDILKVGRVKFAVKEIRYKESTEKMPVDETNNLDHLPVGDITNNQPEFEEYEEVESVTDYKEDEENSQQVDDQEIPRCRFCWSSGASLDNPLFCSCKCAGSVGYIHFSCLKSWLDVKKQCKISQPFSSFYWKSFECEICKKAYPLVIRTQGKTYNLVDYERPEGDFLALESLNQEKNTSRIIHIIRPNEKKDSFKFGRGHESDLRINDISVSRCHAIIKFKDGKFQLEDNLSKFGTLVLIKNKTPLIPNFNKAVQIGRTVINFSVKSINSRNFGPRPSDGLIRGKIEGQKFAIQGGTDNYYEDGDQNFNQHDKEANNYNNNHLIIQDQPPFDLALDDDARDQPQNENRNDEIPNELPDNRKTQGGLNLN